MSNIIHATIDENFPIAGQDNSSQGFRTNFDLIKSALEVAKDEITDLENNVVRTDQDNDLNNVSLNNFIARNYYEPVINGSTAAGAGQSNFWDVSGENSGSYWKGIANTDEVIILRSWPSTGSTTTVYKIRLEFSSTGNNSKTFDAASGSGIINYTSNQLTITNHGFVNGDIVNYNNGGNTSIGGLTNNSMYYTKVINTNVLELHSNSTLTGLVDLVTGSTGNHTLTKRYKITIQSSGGNCWRDDSGKFLENTGGTQSIILSQSSTVRTIIEAWSYDGGSNVFLNYLGQFQV